MISISRLLLDRRVQVVIVICVLLFAFNAKILDVLGAGDYHTGIPQADINYSETMHHRWGCALGLCWTGNIETDYTELIMDDANNPVVTSFSSYSGGGEGDTGLSETITVYATITWDGGFYVWAPNTGYYKVSIMEGGAWKPIIWDGGIDESYIYKMSGTVDAQSWGVDLIDPRTDYDISPLSFRLKGTHVGALHVEVVTDFVREIIFHESHVTSEDWCYLISGTGEINIVGYAAHAVPMFEMGEKVPIRVAADYSGYTIGETGRWELRYFSHGSGMSGIIKTWDYDWIRTTYYWTLPNGIWYRGISDSKVDIELYNTLFSQSAILINTIDIKANAPPTPSITTSNTDPYVGDTVTISGSCDTNANTNEEIEEFHVRAIYIDNSQEVGYWTQVPPSGQDPSAYSIAISNLPRGGMMEVQVWAHDDAGRESAVPGKVMITIHYKGAGEYVDWLKIIIVAIIIITALLVGLFAPIPPQFKPIIMIVGIVIAILFYFFVTVPTEWYLFLEGIKNTLGM